MTDFYIQRKKLHQKLWFRVVVGIFFIALAGGLIAWNQFEAWYDQNITSVAEFGDDVIFEVKTGTPAEELADNLQSQGLIRSNRAFMIYLDRTGQRSQLQAGTYRLNPAMSVQEIVEIIVDGKVDVRLFTIVPGLRIDQLRQDFIDAGFSEDEVKQALSSRYDHPLMDYKPEAADLEGYIFPESFQFTPSTSVASIIQRSFDELNKALDQELVAKLSAQNLSVHESVILASIIGKESSDPETQRKIARVFLNRLEIGQMLGSDPTFRYAAAIAGVEPTVDIDSPYNTRLYTGLPPGPIANFNLSAMTAIANPVNGDWLYFVSGDDGITRFANTFAEHQSNIDQFCDVNCQL